MLAATFRLSRASLSRALLPLAAHPPAGSCRAFTGSSRVASNDSDADFRPRSKAAPAGDINAEIAKVGARGGCAADPPRA